MERIGLGGDTAELIGSGGVGIVQFLAAIPAVMYIDRLGMSLSTPVYCTFVIYGTCP